MHIIIMHILDGIQTRTLPECVSGTTTGAARLAESNPPYTVCIYMCISFGTVCSAWMYAFSLIVGCLSKQNVDLFMQLRARGCPVVLVGTHMDKVDRQSIAQLEDLARRLYIGTGTPIYPQVHLY